MDNIILNKLSVRAPLGASHWPKPGSEDSQQPLFISAAIPISIRPAAVSDSLSDSVNYGTLAKTIEKVITKAVPSSQINSMETLGRAICVGCLEEFPNLFEIQIEVEKPRAHLHANGAGVKMTTRRSGTGCNIEVISSLFYVRDLELPTIIGMNPWERIHRQPVRINLQMDVQLESGGSRPQCPFYPIPFDYGGLADSVSAFTLDSSYETVEAFTTGIARAALMSPAAYSKPSRRHQINQITVSLAKPKAIMFASSAEVCITRTLSDFQDPGGVPVDSDSTEHIPPIRHVAAIALGSNIGDRVAIIQQALTALTNIGIQVIDTSFMYDSEPMYVEDQPLFANAACLVETSLSPHELLDVLKSIEKDIGRLPTFRNGPRVIDLDIILFDQAIISDEEIKSGSTVVRRQLTIPHPRLSEREFVLQPLSDMIPDYKPPRSAKSILEMLQSIPKRNLRKILTFPSMPPMGTDGESISSPCPTTQWVIGERTYTMATLNLTPDSFSDGGLHNAIPAAIEYALDAIANGADIIDVGGYSTRPGAAKLSVEEEVERVVPVCRALRSAGVTIPISVDTFRAEVARRAILEGGANCVNDVRALREEGMRSLVVQLVVPVVMMHSRGTEAGKNKDYGAEGIMTVVRAELGAEVLGAMDAGVRRWNIMVDPGIGFSKTVEGNLELIRDLRRLTGSGLSGLNSNSSSHLGQYIFKQRSSEAASAAVLHSMPTLVGTSRKSYLGELIERPIAHPSERNFATAAANVAAIQQGCDIIRVHDIRDTRDTVKIADALWRPHSHRG